MASRFTRDDVLRLASLARLELTDDDIALFCEQLTQILEYADVVQQIDTSSAPSGSRAVTHFVGAEWRADAPVPGLDRDRLLAGAPDANQAAGLFRVPKVL
jgi:aspartyl-tRNA(Asn)/glutamyl-tRNA(Gln) amidotransferase subunit C